MRKEEKIFAICNDLHVVNIQSFKGFTSKYIFKMIIAMHHFVHFLCFIMSICHPIIVNGYECIYTQCLFLNDVISVLNDFGFGVDFEFGLNSINNMKPGEGYQIKLENSTDFSFPYIETGQFYIEDLSITSNFQNPINTGKNMTLGILANSWPEQLMLGDEIIITDQNNLIVGKSHYRDEITAITIWGDDPLTNEKEGLYINEPFYIKIWHKGENILKNLNILTWIEGNNIYTDNGISVANKIILQQENISEKKLIKIINVLGKETNQKGFNIDIYDDGSVEKKYIIK